MNLNNLHELINRYEENFDMVNNKRGSIFIEASMVMPLTCLIAVPFAIKGINYLLDNHLKNIINDKNIFVNTKKTKKVNLL